MRELPKIALMMLAVTMVLMILPTDAEAEIYEDTLRLHILANSDSPEDQTMKLEIRDRLLSKYGELLRSERSFARAEAKASELIPEIEKTVAEWIRELGYDYGVSVIIGKEWYETREYEDFSLPAGYYSSLRVIIGEGEGKNWWCVMYPPLCMELATESAPPDDGLIDYSKEELALIKSEKYTVKFKILEDLSRLFAKNG